MMIKNDAEPDPNWTLVERLSELCIGKIDEPLLNELVSKLSCIARATETLTPPYHGHCFSMDACMMKAILFIY